MWLPLLYTYLLATLSYADHLLGNQDFDDSDDNSFPGRRWSFYRQHRYDIKKPGPTYFFHEPDSKELKDVQSSNYFNPIKPGFTEGIVQWLPFDGSVKGDNNENNNPDETMVREDEIEPERLTAKFTPDEEPSEPLETVDDLAESRPLLALLEDVAQLMATNNNKDEPILMETLNQDENQENELSQDNVPINRFQYDPNVWNAYQDNRFEVNEPLVNYLSQLPDLNDYLTVRDVALSSNLNQKPIFSDNLLSSWSSSVPDESGSNHPVESLSSNTEAHQKMVSSNDEHDNEQSESIDKRLNSNIEPNDKSLPKETQDGAQSSVNENVEFEEPLSSLPLEPIKLINPKELNLVLDRPDAKVKKRFVTSPSLSSLPSSSSLPGYPNLESQSSQSLTVLTVSLCLTVFAALIAGLVLFVIRRNQNLRSKLRNLIGSIGSAEEGNETASDYEDLCRQRMQGKNRKKSDKDESSSPGSKGKTASSGSNNNNCDVKTGKTGTDSKSIDSGPEPSPPSRSSTSSWSEEPITSNLDISTGHMILSYMEDHLKNKDRLAKEWEALCAYEVDPCSTTAALLPQNASKNRYPDVLPFDHSRVILNDLANSNRSDYINASTITDHDPRSPVYIVTQGPMPSTVADFWQMVWEQGSVIIVMLTRLLENGVASSARYWPEEGSALHSNFEVHLVSEHIWCDDYLVRSFFLKNIKTNETRTVTQFHYLSWPENGVPPNARSLLEFRRKVNKSYRGRSCPIVVHCSDGIGRTGTYCLIDMVLNRLAKGAKEIDIAATLEHIRDQRGGSVKSKAQFEFVLEAIAEEVSAILKTLKPN